MRLTKAIRCTFQWQIDAAAIRVSKRATGNLKWNDLDSVAAAVNKSVRGGAVQMVFGLSLQRLPSKLNSSAGRHQRELGGLFVNFTSLLQKLLAHFPKRRACLLAENVTMQNAADVRFFSRVLRAEPVMVMVDASDYKAISRPRLSWPWIPWPEVHAHILGVFGEASTEEAPQQVGPAASASAAGLHRGLAAGLLFHSAVRELPWP